MRKPTIFIDSREHAKAIKGVRAYFDSHGIQHFSTKLFVGDYQRADNSLLVIDRKQNIAELAQNATSGHDRFKRELERCDAIGAHMVVLVEQDHIDKEQITDITDICLWKPTYSEIVGERVYRVLNTWQFKHNVSFQFCNKRETGRKIVEILTHMEKGTNWNSF